MMSAPKTVCVCVRVQRVCAFETFIVGDFAKATAWLVFATIVRRLVLYWVIQYNKNKKRNEDLYIESYCLRNHHIDVYVMIIIIQLDSGGRPAKPMQFNIIKKEVIWPKNSTPMPSKQNKGTISFHCSSASQTFHVFFFFFVIVFNLIFHFDFFSALCLFAFALSLTHCWPGEFTSR